MTCCVQCRKKYACPNSTVFNPIMTDDATVKQALAFKELARRLNLTPEVVVDNFEQIAEIITQFKPKETFYP